MVKAKDMDKVQLSSLPVENFVDYQQKRYIDKGQPVPKEIIGEYHEHLVHLIEQQSKTISDQLTEAEEGVNIYQSRLYTGTIALEYETAHNTAIKAIYEENDL